MKIDIVGSGDMTAIAASGRTVERLRADGLFMGEKAHDPFVALAPLAASRPSFDIGTAIAVAFARNPMNLAMMAHDLQTASGGRFVLGLGSQVAAHIRRRFSMPWSRPVERMSELIAALRAIWASWNEDVPLDFEGDFYTHTLMAPLFKPRPTGCGPPPVYLAAVGTRMTRAAAEAADGLIVHSFTTEKFLREATLPTLEAGLSGAQRTRSSFTVSLPLFVATGGDDEALDVAVRATRERIAFYGSTPAYRPVLELHGWGSLQTDLNHLARAGLWSQMADAIDDEILHAFAVVGEPAEVGVEITRRFAGAVDRVSLATPVPLDEESLALVVDRARESMPAGTMPSPGRTPPV